MGRGQYWPTASSWCTEARAATAAAMVLVAVINCIEHEPNNLHQSRGIFIARATRAANKVVGATGEQQNGAYWDVTTLSVMVLLDATRAVPL